MQRSIRRQELLSSQDGECEICHSEDNIDEENSTVQFDDAYSTIDKIVSVCCACINMCPPVVPQE